ncbi:Cytochrome P450 4c3 [Orchesella cincta]|uniref:Cytochrome P450 4c3 n=1 Tax=Orchesella cincta TaxID=48709 RepID=A0A1D2N4K0_ORCCI|nr:Cytochrome P450 4c3 [Orchesella cincta]
MFEPVVNSVFSLDIVVHAVVFIGALVALFCYLTQKDPRIYKHLKEINGPLAWPFVGNALALLGPHENIIPTIMGWVKIHGPTFSAWIGNIPYVIVADAFSVEKILSSNTHINKGKDYEQFLINWLGTGLLVARREKWFHRRKLLTPTFHFKILEDFLPIFNTNAQILTAVLEKQLQQTDSFDICPFISRCTMDIICETAMGEKINAQIGGEEEYVKMVAGMTDILLIKGITPWYRNEYIWNMTNLGKMETKYLKAMHDFTDRMIRYRKSDRKRKSISERRSSNASVTNENPEGQKIRRAFLDLLLDVQENDAQFTDADIREEVDTFMFEGHDTTGANLEWAILMLACNPKCQKLAYEEIQNVFGNDTERDITTADLKELKYLECCIKETLRIYPSVPFFMRRMDQDCVLDEHRTIPKGSTVIISAYILHRQEDVFPDPEKFDPERFFVENAAGRHPYSYIPFSAGPRNCIGQKFALMEEKIVLATLLRKFKLEPVDTEKTVRPLPDVILRPKAGLKVRLVSRE